MFVNVSRNLIVIIVLILIFNCMAVLSHAQAPAAETGPSAVDLHRQVEQLQCELQYLRQRDAQRQAWENAIIHRLPATDSYLVAKPQASADGTIPCAYSCRSHTSETCQPTGCSQTTCNRNCGCCSFQCTLPPAPCINCPRVSTQSPYFNVRIFGAMKLDMLFSDARPVAPGTPFFLSPGSVAGHNQNTVDIHARQSMLGATFTGPCFYGLQSGGQIIGLFYNDNVMADKYGFLPMQAWGELKNESWRFAAGLQFDVFSPIVPTVLPFSALGGSGAAGNSFRGQVRLERYLRPSDDTQWTLQFALSEPITTTIDPTFRFSEDNGWPNVEGRIALGLGAMQGAGVAAKRPIEIGFSGVVGQIRTTVANPPFDRVVADVWGASTDFRWQITKRFGVMGEVFTGQTLGTYNGGILQNINADTLEGIRSSGGWLEVFVFWTPDLHSHIGYGVDDPVDRDVADSLAALGRIYNSTYYGNLLWDLNQTFRVGFELTWRETEYKTLPNNDGAGFHTQFQWAF